MLFVLYMYTVCSGISCSASVRLLRVDNMCVQTASNCNVNIQGRIQDEGKEGAGDALHAAKILLINHL